MNVPAVSWACVGQFLQCLALCVSASSQAQRWRSENFERPVDLEGSGDDDSFPDDELDYLYSGSGSGCK